MISEHEFDIYYRRQNIVKSLICCFLRRDFIRTTTRASHVASADISSRRRFLSALRNPAAPVASNEALNSASTCARSGREMVDGIWRRFEAAAMPFAPPILRTLDGVQRPDEADEVGVCGALGGRARAEGGGVCAAARASGVSLTSEPNGASDAALGLVGTKYNPVTSEQSG